MVCESFGALWLLSCLLSSLGTVNQIKFNSRRQSVAGLSFFDSEIRLYGKLPWIIFACGVGATDWWIISANLLGIALALVLLFQFLHYNESPKRYRIYFGFISVLIAFSLPVLMDLKSYQEIAKFLPVFISVIIVPLASRSQYLLNKRNKSQAVTPTRYFLYLLSNFAAFAYAISKLQIVGPSETWPLLLAAMVGVCANSIMLMQVLRESSIFNLSWLPSHHYALAKTK